MAGLEGGVESSELARGAVIVPYRIEAVSSGELELSVDVGKGFISTVCGCNM